MLDFDDLRCFDAAATQLNFRRAAEAVHLSPTAFSDRIRRLEDTLGLELFARTTRSVRLTVAGAALVPQARRTLAEAQRCHDVVREAEPPPTTLSLGTRYELGLSWLLPATATLRKRTPSRRFGFVFGDSDDLLERVRTGRLDACVTSARLSHAHGWARYAALHEEHYVFVAPHTAEPLRGPDDAERHALLDVHADLSLFRYFLDAQPAAETWRFRELETLGAISAVRARLLDGAGVAVLPKYFVAADLKAKRLRVVLPRRPLLHDAFRLVWRADSTREAELHTLSAELRGFALS